MRMSLARLQAWAERDEAIGRALRDAETAAQAWWEGAQRDAFLEGARINAGAWRAAMEWRFGSEKTRSKSRFAPLARYEIPDNGKERRRR